MKERLEICLLRPKFIAKFISDKLRYPVLFALFFIMLSTVVYGVSIYSDSSSGITYYSERQLFVNINRDNTDIVISEDGVSTTESFYYEGTSVILGFNISSDDIVVDTRSVIVFNQTTIDSYYVGSMIYSYYYQDIDTIDFSAIRESDLDEIANFVVLLNYIIDDLNYYIIPSLIFANFTSIVISYVILILFIYFLTYNIGVALPKKLKVNLIIYSSIIYLVFVYFSQLFNVSLLESIGMIFAYIYTIKATKSIIKIQIKRKQ